MNPRAPITAPAGHYGPYGGRYVAETLMPALIALEQAYRQAAIDPDFQTQFRGLLRDYVGRPSPIYLAERLTRAYGGARLYLKREDLNHTGAHKINNTLGQALLARRMGKTRLMAETGAGQHGVATATAAALLGMRCDIYMGAEDIRRQATNVQRMEFLGAAVHPVRNGDEWPRSAGCDEAFWDECLNVNARGPFFLTRAVLPEMAKKRYGRVVFVASVTGLHGKHASPPYNASKAAIIVLTKSFAEEYGPDNVNVNCVCPGYVNTDMSFNQDEKAVATFRAGTPLRRTAEPIDIAHTILSLLEDDLFVTGQTLVCDGGVVMH